MNPKIIKTEMGLASSDIRRRFKHIDSDNKDPKIEDSQQIIPRNEGQQRRIHSVALDQPNFEEFLEEIRKLLVTTSIRESIGVENVFRSKMKEIGTVIEMQKSTYGLFIDSFRQQSGEFAVLKRDIRGWELLIGILFGGLIVFTAMSAREIFFSKDVAIRGYVKRNPSFTANGLKPSNSPQVSNVYSKQFKRGEQNTKKTGGRLGKERTSKLKTH